MVQSCRAAFSLDGGAMLEAEELSALIGDIYDAALDPTLWPQVLPRSAQFVGGPAYRRSTRRGAPNSRTVVRGSVLLVAYSAGLGFAFLLAGVAFARAMTVFRWLRDHYVVIQRASGAVLVALGLLLFFHRDWWLRVALNHVLSSVGLGGV